MLKINFHLNCRTKIVDKNQRGFCGFCWHFVHRESEIKKKQDTKLLLTISPNVNQFSKKFSLSDLAEKFATKSCLNIPPRLEHVDTLPCETQMSEN